MKKLISILSLTVGLLVSATAFVACGSNDDDSTEDNKSSKRITKIINEGEYDSESTYSYDSQGRIVKIVGEANYRSGRKTSSVETIQYGETLIVSKGEGNETDSNGQTSYSILHSYTLDKGLIIKEEEKQEYSYNNSYETAPYSYSHYETVTYSYDANGRLASISKYGTNIDSHTDTVIWSNGNISSIGDMTYISSDIPLPKGFPFNLRGSGMNTYLFSMGYYGNIPRNLISSCKHHDSDGSTYERTYDYTLQDGLVTKVVETHVDDYESLKWISTIFWE